MGGQVIGQGGADDVAGPAVLSSRNGAASWSLTSAGSRT